MASSGRHSQDRNASRASETRFYRPGFFSFISHHPTKGSDTDKGGMRSTAADMIRFVQVNIDQSQLAGPMQRAESCQTGRQTAGALRPLLVQQARLHRRIRRLCCLRSGHKDWYRDAGEQKLPDSCPRQSGTCDPGATGAGREIGPMVAQACCAEPARPPDRAMPFS